MHKTTLYLDEPSYERLRRLAEGTGRTQAAIIREALQAYAAGRKRKPRSVGLGRSGMGNLSERAEKFLKGMGSDR
jgi:predicted transcriptional regulator